MMAQAALNSMACRMSRLLLEPAVRSCYGLPDEQAAVGACRQKLYVKEVAVSPDHVQGLNSD